MDQINRHMMNIEAYVIWFIAGVRHVVRLALVGWLGCRSNLQKLPEGLLQREDMAVHEDNIPDHRI